LATLTTSDIIFYYTNTGSTIASNLSLGSTINSNVISDSVNNNVFDDITGDQSASGIIEYRCIACKDIHASASMLNTKVFISDYSRAVANNDVISFALENPTNGTNPVQLIGSDTIAPNTSLFIVANGSTVNWVEEGNPSSTLSFGTIDASKWMGIWLRRVTPSGANAFGNRTVTITILCETTGSPRHTIVKELTLNANTLFYKISKDGKVNDIK
jgi:hypothetical protein